MYRSLSRPNLTSLVERCVCGIEPVRHDFSDGPYFQAFQHLVRRQAIHVLEVCLLEGGRVQLLKGHVR